jgi:precorrin-2 dehydrogenase/sirohydrochlorin ferrochelatase
MPEYFSIMLDVRGREALVVGDSHVAVEKAAALSDAGAHVRLLSGWPTGGDVREAFVIVAVTNDVALIDFLRTTMGPNQLLNVMDRPEACNFVFTSVLRRGPLTISVSTNGTAPAMARLVRQRIEADFGPEWETFMHVAATARAELCARRVPWRDRVEFFAALMQSDVLVALADGDVGAAQRRVGDLMHATR